MPIPGYTKAALFTAARMAAQAPAFTSKKVEQEIWGGPPNDYSVL
jgi:hypothetical protein